jgi:hypothetical protein
MANAWCSHQTGHEFFGCIAFELVRARNLPNVDLWKQRFSELFNFAVFPFYWAGYERQPGLTMQDETLAAVKWCTENGITTKGHPLVWTDQAGTPKWLQELSPQESEQRMLARVTREVGGFAGAIDIWDVVNEPPTAGVETPGPSPRAQSRRSSTTSIAPSERPPGQSQGPPDPQRILCRPPGGPGAPSTRSELKRAAR